MKSSNVSSLFSRVMVLSLSLSLLSVQSVFAFAVPGSSVSAAEITVNGKKGVAERPFVVVNGQQAFSGRTFFSGGNIETTEATSATINLGKLGRIDLSPSSSFTLSFSEGRIAGTLSKGNVSVSNTDGVAVSIDTPHDSVRNEGTSSSRFTVSVADGKTRLAVENGTVRANGGLTARQDDDDDDDDDDDWKVWAWVGVIGGVIGAIIIWKALDDDDEIVSPVR